MKTGINHIKDILKVYRITYKEIAEGTGYTMEYVRYLMHKNASSVSDKFINKVSDYIYGRIEEIKKMY